MRVKEYLSVRGIEFESINVVADPKGRAALAALGARSVPVVAQGGAFVFAQLISDVVTFLGLDDDAAPALAPRELADRLERHLKAGAELVGLLPDACLERELPNRPRSWRVLAHHVFQVADAFVEAERTGFLDHDTLMTGPADELRTAADIAAFGDAARQRFASWWALAADSDFTALRDTYFGTATRHELLERTVWHATQHVRQVASLLEEAGVDAACLVELIDITGLPLTERIWDD